MDNDKHQVIVQKWEETERSWGQRPDGFSLHVTDEDRQAYIKEYWDGMPTTVPEEYSRPNGTPYTAEVDAECFAKVKASKNGVREGGEPPGSGGIDGWRSQQYPGRPLVDALSTSPPPLFPIEEEE